MQLIRWDDLLSFLCCTQHRASLLVEMHGPLLFSGGKGVEIFLQHLLVFCSPDGVAAHGVSKQSDLGLDAFRNSVYGDQEETWS